MILVHGSAKATEALRGKCATFCDKILTPSKGELLEISTRTRAFNATIAADAYTGLVFSKVGGGDVAFVDGVWDRDPERGLPMLREIRGTSLAFLDRVQANNGQ